MSDSIRCTADDNGFYSYLKGRSTYQKSEPETIKAANSFSQYGYSLPKETKAAEENSTPKKGYSR